MREQRRRPRDRSRRGFLRAAGAVGIAGVAGCVGSGFSRGEGGGTTDDGPVSILAAGSLQNALSSGLEPAVDVPIRVETHGSATVARLVAEGKRDPDIVSVADVALFERSLSTAWHSVFASNAIVIAYNSDTEGGKHLAEAGGTEDWYDVLAGDDVRIGRTDPDRDPLGYRTLFTLDLASRYYDDAANLRKRILERDQIYPETSLISRFESGAIDAAIAYRNMAEERGYEYIDLPDRIDLSNPRYEEWYSTVSYTLPSGQRIRGGLISYGSTIHTMSDAALDAFAAHTTGNYLGKHGFVLRASFPTHEGSVPQRVERATDQSGGNRAVLDGSTVGPSPAADGTAFS